MKFLKHAALAALALGTLTACNKDKEKENLAKGEQTVLVALDLPKLKVGAPEGVNKEFNEELPNISSVNIYLVQSDGKIAKAKSITKDDTANSDWVKLVDPTANTATGGGGIKFLNIPASVNRVIVEANALSALTEGSSWINREVTTTLNSNVYMVGQDAALKDLGKEPFSPEPGTDKTINVKQANVTIKPIASRIQIVGLKLYSYTKATSTYTENTTAKVIGVVVNRFSEKATVAAADLAVTAETQKLYASSAAGFIMTNLFDDNTTVAGLYKLPFDDQGVAKDVTDIAAYKKNATTTSIIIDATKEKAESKALAFNFFPQGIVSTTDPKGVTNTNPKIHLIIKMADNSIKFVNISSFKTASDEAVTFEPGKLYNINLSNDDEKAPSAGTPADKTPVIVDSDDPNNPPVVTPDISTKEVNLIARVTVAKWSAENLKPVFDK